MKAPKEIFTSQAELDLYLKYWQDKLFLNDWIIRAKVVTPDQFESGCDIMGENHVDFVNKCCIIRIVNPRSYGDCMMRYCAEKILVHELLHCKYNFNITSDTYEGNYLDLVEHSMLEQLSKTLIMTKYNIPFSYFADNYESQS